MFKFMAALLVVATSTWAAPIMVNPAPPPATTTVTGYVIRKDNDQPVEAYLTSSGHIQAFMLLQTALNYHPARTIDELPLLKTAEDGSFDLGKLRPSSTFSLMYVRAWPLDPTLFHIGGYREVDFSETSPVSDIRIYIGQGCAIEGRLLDVDGNPVAGAWVNVSPGEQFENVTTDQDGNFKLHHLRTPDVPIRITSTDVKVTVGPVGKGKVLRGLILQPEQEAMRRLRVRGSVVDEKGRGVGGAYITLRPPTARSKHGWGFTERDGRFEIDLEWVEPATFTRITHGEISLRRDIPLGEGTGRLYAFYEVLRGLNAKVPEGGELRDVRIVVRTPPYVLGRATDDAGVPVEPEIHFMGTGNYADHFRVGSNGIFFAANSFSLPEGPFSMEFSYPGHQTVVVPFPEGLTGPVEDLEVTLKRGPFPEDQSVFFAVTGIREEQADSVPRHDLVRARLAAYVARASEGVAPVRRLGPPRISFNQPAKPKRWRIRVLEPDGEPATELYIAKPQIRFGGIPNHLTRTQIRPDMSSMTDYRTNMEGFYTLSRPWKTIWSESSAYHLFPEPEPQDEATTVQLELACAVILTFLDHSGTRVSPVAITQFNDLLQRDPPLIHDQEDGVITLERLVSGAYSYGAPPLDERRRPSMRITFNLAPGQTLTREIRRGDPELHTILQGWREMDITRISFGPTHRVRDPDLAARLRESSSRHIGIGDDLDRSTRKDIGKEIVRLIHSLAEPVAVDFGYDIAFLARAAEGLEHRPAVKSLKRWLRALPPIKDRPTYKAIGGFEIPVNTMVTLTGTKLVPFFVKTARDPSLSPRARTLAVLGLGKIATKKSAKAFRDIRREFQPDVSLEGKPETQLMAEAAQFAFDILPYTPDGVPKTHVAPEGRFDSSGQHDFGIVGVTDRRHGGTSSIYMRKVHGIWIPSDMGSLWYVD